MFATNKIQYVVYLGLSLGIVGFTTILYNRGHLFFERYFGGFNPLAAMILIAILGIVLLAALLKRSWFVVYRTWTLQWLSVPAYLAALFALVIILVDLTVLFPRDMNVLFPESLLFYPVMGFVVEILFHLLPLSVLLFALTFLTRGMSYDNIIWPCLLIVALLEPIYQTMTGSLGNPPVWVTGYVFLHIFLINLVELAIFKQYDFVSMYSFRLLYYLLWHIAWGYLRLRLLF